MSEQSPALFSKDTLIKGQPAQVSCVEIDGQTFSVDSGFIKTIRLEDEWFEEVKDPAAVVSLLTGCHQVSADLFTFCQRLPHIAPRYQFACDFESIAAIEIDSYETWWQQLDRATRNMVRKSAKSGIEVREACSMTTSFVASRRFSMRRRSGRAGLSGTMARTSRPSGANSRVSYSAKT